MNDRLAPWQTLHQQTLADCSPWLRLHQEHVRLPNGVEISDYYRIQMPEYVIVFAVTSENMVIMAEHYKHGPQSLSLELPAGYIESNDAPLATAQRELLEETGYTARQWQSLGRFFVDGNRGCGWCNMFLAFEAEVRSTQQLEDTELINVQLITFDSLRALWLAGKLPNIAATAIVGLAFAHIQPKTL